MAKTRWYTPRSKINTNKKEANRIAKGIRARSGFKTVRVVSRTLPKDKKTKTPRTKGYWIKVSK